MVLTIVFNDCPSVSLSESMVISTFRSPDATFSATSTVFCRLAIRILILFLRSLKSPLYSSVMASGRSPLEIRLMRSAAVLTGVMTASKVSLIPLMIPAYSPSTRVGLPRTDSRPSWAASVNKLISFTIFLKVCTMTSKDLPSLS